MKASPSELSHTRTRAAQYVRMSTDYQKYSPENQKLAISKFAVDHNIEIVATYEDTGKSGLTLHGRKGLQRLLADVHAADREFDQVLVFDVSRWGRFQDVDESAHYEYVCRQAGVKVTYCQESFNNDGTPASNLLKTLKRAMAGEYSRELSAKVYAGQCRLAERGFWQGASAGFGLQRILVDAHRRVKGPLKDRERKSLQTDRVIIVPGKPSEVALVRRIFEWYVEHGIGPYRIARRLNDFGICNARAGKWPSQLVGNILNNEKYAGANIYGRTATKLNAPWKRNPESEWVRAPLAFEPVIDPSVFKAAHNMRRRRTRFLTDDELLDRLGCFAKSARRITQKTIDLERTLPAGQTYARRFGSVLNAYTRIGYEPRCHGMSPEVFRASRSALRARVQHVADQLRIRGHSLAFSADGNTVTVDNELSIRFVARLVRHYDCRSPRWKVRWPLRSSPHLLAVFRLDAAFASLVDVHLFPRGSLPPGRELAISIGKGREGILEKFRFPDESILIELTARCPLEMSYERPDTAAD
ncbi:Site-specific DNA recombinase [Paraburkholderia steynii]|uniref:Site-specific DNA recombinase n=1 Tax=Paraburkholderia steynii TaxID=1245441 RepID=A0A7Z7FP92_9BURK|nr:recombinase family protein [Paraburkholderia steynii]SDJ22629.1 Site-specific DNA recombinase [Paraburkholderia steynii]